MSQLDPGRYLRLPIVDVGRGLALARALLRQAPAGASEPEQAAALALREAAVAVQNAWIETRRAEARGVPVVPVDQALDAAWLALHQRLEALSAPSEERAHEVEQANSFFALLFADGLGWLDGDYEHELAESQKRLELLSEADRASALDALCGPSFLLAIRAAEEAYAAVLAVTTRRTFDAEDPFGLPPAVGPLLRELGRAVKGYALAVLSEADDARATQRAEALLAPIEQQHDGPRSDEELVAPIPLPAR